jgi:hypothetical protein
MVTSFFPKAYYLFPKSILPFGKEVGISDNLGTFTEYPYIGKTFA